MNTFNVLYFNETITRVSSLYIKRHFPTINDNVYFHERIIYHIDRHSGKDQGNIYKVGKSFYFNQFSVEFPQVKRYWTGNTSYPLGWSITFVVPSYHSKFICGIHTYPLWKTLIKYLLLLFYWIGRV